MKNVLNELLDGAKSMVAGLGITADNFKSEPVTRHYPLDKPKLPAGSRGVLRMVEFFEEDTTLNKTDYYPGSKHAPCIRGCPANTDARGYVSCASEGKFTEGYQTLKMTYPFSGTLGRVCPAPCEDICTRGVAGPEPISIRRLKRFYDDFEQLLPVDQRVHYQDRMKPLNGRKAAIVGSGPAGLQVAFELALEGWEVTVFERCPIPMGYVSLTIPRFRLENIVWEREVQSLTDTGRITVQYGVSIGKDRSFEDLRKEFETVVIAAGATKPLRLGIPGEDGDGVYTGEPWLEDMKFGKFMDVKGKNVVIVGGGSTSTDCGRTALRLGAKAIITYRRTRAEMPASHLEVEDAIEEGVDIQFLVSPLAVARDDNGKVTGLK
ncbi:MAG TPA: FAD-dependent oxidoreductase, partial [Candidatus Xenobia bacterium]